VASTRGIYDIPVVTIDGQETTLAPYQGKVLLIVNVASKCGFTPQYEGLEALQEKYAARGFSVLGFPCNQFGSQEPGTEADIREFCQLTYGVKFPMFAKVDVNGDNAHPLYQHLKAEKRGFLGSRAIKWNFTKFLVAKNGAVVDRYPPTTKPENLTSDIEKALNS
jgi:glutathione peroxidase